MRTQKLKLAFLLVVFSQLFFTTSALADAVCKVDKMPIDYAAVGELRSPQCPGYTTNPFENNAWEVMPVVDGSSYCNLPPPPEIGPLAASLLPCEKTILNKCPRRPDGLPNGIVLRSPRSCLQNGLPRNIKLYCTTNHPFGGREPLGEFWPMVAEVDVEDCPKWDLDHIRVPDQILARKTAYMVRKHESHGAEPTPICASRYNYQYFNSVVVKRFHNPNCPLPPPGTAGRDIGLNAWIISSLEMLEGRNVICAIQDFFPPEKPPQRDEKESLDTSHHAKEGRGRRTKSEFKTFPKVSFERSLLSKYSNGELPPSRYEVQCGGPEGNLNAHEIRVKKTKLKGRFGDYVYQFQVHSIL